MKTISYADKEKGNCYVHVRSLIETHNDKTIAEVQYS